MSNKRSEGQQPEALKSLEAAAQSGSQKPKEQGITATDRTAPRSAPLDQQEQAAAEVLKAGVNKDGRGMEEAAKKTPRK